MAFAIDNAAPELWLPGDAIPQAFEDPSAVFIAHNAAFEILVYREKLVKDFGFPQLPATRWECSAARAGYGRLPQKLSKLSKTLDLGDYGKDKAGHENMMALCRPIGGRLIDGIYHGGHFDDNFVKHEWNRDYCKQDVIAEGRVCELTPAIPEREQRVWQLHRRINERGVPVDVELCRGAVTILDVFFEESCRRLAKLTNDAITSPDQTEKLRAFLTSRGLAIADLEAGTVDAVLAKGVDDEVCRDVLTIRKQLSSAAVKKFQSALVSADSDGRCREGFKYYGAGPGRWSGNGTQFQNLRRPRQSWPEESIAAITSGDIGLVKELSGGDIFSLLADHVRSIICAPPGRKLVISDFAAIEARKLRWLIGDEAGLDVYRRFDAGTGHESYVMQASRIYGLSPDEIADPITKKARPEHKDKRQIGKVAELQLGYGAGWSKYQSTVLDWTGIAIADEFAREVVENYRRSNTLITDYWRNSEQAAVQCVKYRRDVRLGRLRFHLWRDWMCITLPSGRDLFYFQPEIGASKFDKPSVWYTSAKGRKNLYGGLITENIDQGDSRDNLVDAMFRIEVQGIFLVMHCHDETVSETREDDDRSERVIHEAMETIEPWAAGLPVRAETHSSRRYTK